MLERISAFLNGQDVLQYHENTEKHSPDTANPTESLSGDSARDADNAVGPDGFVIGTETPYAEAHRLLHSVEREALASSRRLGIIGYPTGKAALNEAPERRIELIRAAYVRGNWLFDAWHSKRLVPHRSTSISNSISNTISDTISEFEYNRLSAILADLGRALLSRARLFRVEDVTQLLELALHEHEFACLQPEYKYWDGSSRLVVKVIAEQVAKQGLLPAWYPLLERLNAMPRPAGDPDALAMARIFGYDRLGLMLPGSFWANCVLQELAALETAAQEKWVSLLQRAAALNLLRKPTAAWLKATKALIDKIGEAEVRERLTRWLPLVGKPATQWKPDGDEIGYLHGLVWLTVALDDSLLCRQVGRVAEDSEALPLFRHACFEALATMSGRTPVLELTRLQTKITNSYSRELLDKALTLAAKRSKLSRNELDDLSVPTFDMQASGQLRHSFGAYSVAIIFSSSGKGGWQWTGKDGKFQKSVPTEVKRDHAAELDALKAYVQNIEAMREFQSVRIENFYRSKHDWSLTEWQERYAKHPLLSIFAHTLIWQLNATSESTESPGTEETDAGVKPGVLAIWREDRFEDLSGTVPTALTETTRVRLWHPVGTSVETVLAWRERLTALGITQPFKQAYREAYLLTEAERDTNLYSNRFAAHILRQFPFHRLCKKMGWENRLRVVNGTSDKRAVYPLPDWNLQAEFWIEPVDDQNRQQQEAQSYNYLSTDQVRFSEAIRGRNKPVVPLASVSAQLFWEIMRDVDRLVTHSSVVNDAHWQDRGVQLLMPENDSLTVYSGTALGIEARRETLAKLLPRLNISPRCTLGDTFLTVCGDVRTYKIHLGTSHIQMEPNDQYLCIIRSRVPAGEAQVNPAALPFEGDTTLALILSKAFLLAEDTAITDQVILHQIHPRIF